MSGTTTFAVSRRSSASSASSNSPPPSFAAAPAIAAAGRLTDQSLQVLDPLIKGGKVPVPLEATFSTKGRTDWLAGKARRDLSVCCLFHKGRCFADKNCHQVHVDRPALEAIRHEYRNVVSCCLHCNDNGSLSEEARTQLWSSKAFTAIETVFFQGAEGTESDIVSVPRERLGFTTGLVESFAAVRLHSGLKTFSLPASRICRLHLRDDCKYGRDCKNIHVCRPTFARAFGVAPPAACCSHVKPAAAATTKVVIAAVPQQWKKTIEIRAAAAAAGVAAPLMTFMAIAAEPEAAVAVPQAASHAPFGLMGFQPAPSFLRANYPTLDQSSLRLAANDDDCLEITFRPFDRLCDFDGLSPSNVGLDIFGESPASTGTASSTKARQSSATLDSPTSFFHAMASPM